MFRRLHKDKKSCKMDDPRHIGISKLDFAFGLELGVHFRNIWLLAIAQRLNPVTFLENPGHPRIDSMSQNKCASVRPSDPP